MLKKITPYILLLLFPIHSFAQVLTIKGKVTDIKGKPLEMVDVIFDNYHATSTAASGRFSLTIPTETGQLIFRRSGLISQEFKLYKGVATQKLSIKMNISEEAIDEVDVNANRINSSTITRIDPQLTDVMTSVSGGVEGLVKSQLGVNSRSELSSQYSVRGGNYDENLVYVNGIEVYRPQLIRSGRQEGLSFVNPELASSVRFSAGGFEAKYGGKMSSVLDIRYKKPDTLSASVSTSLLGASAFLGGTAGKNKRFTHISGVRYKSNKYVLNTLETEGDYNPTFFDFQTYLTFEISTNLELSFLANISQNKYEFKPISRETAFGTIGQSVALYIDFNGQEVDKFQTYMSALSLKYTPHSKFFLRFTASAFQAEESETFDILGRYSLNQLNTDIGSGSAGDSTLNLGIGLFLNHARNYLYISSQSFTHQGFLANYENEFHWGATLRNDAIRDKLDEYELLDSADYSIPISSSDVLMSQNVKAKNKLINQKISAFFQDTYKFETENTDFEFTTGLRANYSTYSREFLLSPRLAAMFLPISEHNHVFRAASGVYYQPVFYREIRNYDGRLEQAAKAQRSIHFLLGNEFAFKAFGRNFKMFSEIYYKKLDNLIPYEVDNVRIRYYANQRAKGYTAGADFKVSGEFVPGTNSWFNISLMKTEEDIFDMGNGQGDDYGYIPRPSDQLLSASIFFQDYVPGYPFFKAHLSLMYGSRLPVSVPHTERGLTIPRGGGDYKRVDIGFSFVPFDKKRRPKLRLLRPISSLWLTAEVFNLLGVNNTVSYLWIRPVQNIANAGGSIHEMYAVPNHLTARLLNIKLSVRF